MTPDALLGRVPMVRLALWCLLALAAIALLAALPGLVAAPAPALLASLAVALGVSWGGARLMGALAGAAPQDASALVTGLILFFLLSPAGSPEALLTLAAAALVAAASKYLVTVGGRHVLNPAATGAVVVGLAGLPASSWWVASPVLLPFVTVAAILLTIRTRTLLPAAVLVLLGVVLEVTGAVAAGFDGAATAAAAFLSTPLVFVAGVLFPEPLTLPPARWQRLVEAAVVAVVLALPYLAPFRLLTFTPSPEAAVLAGDVVALLLARPLAVRLRFAGRRPVTRTTTEYAFRPERPVRHRPGQYLELQVRHAGADRRGMRRTLTIVSPPGEPEVRVAVRTREPLSSFKQALDALPLGAEVRAVSVSGAFTLPADRSVPLLLVASGIGITPFVSQLAADATAEPRDVLLVDRVPAADDIPYRDVLARSGVRVLLVCPDPVPGLPDHWHLADRFDAAVLGRVLADPERRLALVAGSPGFVARAKRVLREAGVRRIRTDAFAGY